MVDSPMLFASHNLQVARSVIELVPITVMHYFIGTQRSSYFPTCDITVNSHVTVFTGFGTSRLVLLDIAFFCNVRLMPS